MATMLLVLGGGLLFVVILVYTLFCGDAPQHEGGVLPKVQNCVMAFIDPLASETVRRWVKWIAGEWCCTKMEAAEDYCCFQRNLFMPGVYVVFVSGAYYCYYVAILVAYVPGERSDGIPFAYGLVMWALLLISVALWITCLRTDPGIVSVKNSAEHQVYPFDGVIYIPKECSTCKLMRPPRAKHCRTCNLCIARFDHHCPWINTCVGAHNIRWFISFLVFHVLLTGYGGWLACWALVHEVARAQLWQARYLKDGAAVPVDYEYIARWLLVYHGQAVIGAAVMWLIAIVLGCFAGYHLWNALCNETTNETYKWKKQKWKAKQCTEEDIELLLRQRQEVIDENPKELAAGWSISQQQPGEANAAVLTHNVYNRGLLSNMREIFFPLQLPLAQAARTVESEKHSKKKKKN